MLHTVIVVIQVLAAIGVISLVLLQHGKGADAGASFGSGASQTFFGSAGSGNFLTHATAVCATIFFCASLGLAHINKKAVGTAGGLRFDKLVEPAVAATPASDLPSLPSVSVASGDLSIPVASAMPVVSSSDLPVEPAVIGQPAKVNDGVSTSHSVVSSEEETKLKDEKAGSTTSSAEPSKSGTE